MGDPTPLPPSVGNNALGVTRSIVASWLCVAACKNRIQLFEGFVRESRRNVSWDFYGTVPPHTPVRDPLYPGLWAHAAVSRRASSALRLTTFVARTDFFQSPQLVHRQRGGKLYQTPQCLSHSWSWIQLLYWAVLSGSWGGVSFAGCSLQSLCLHASVSMPVVRWGDNMLHIYQHFNKLQWNQNKTDINHQTYFHNFWAN